MLGRVLAADDVVLILPVAEHSTLVMLKERTLALRP